MTWRSSTARCSVIDTWPPWSLPPPLADDEKLSSACPWNESTPRSDAQPLDAALEGDAASHALTARTTIASAMRIALPVDPREAGDRERERPLETGARARVAAEAVVGDAMEARRAVLERNVLPGEGHPVADELDDPRLCGRARPARPDRLGVIGDPCLMKGRAHPSGAGCAGGRGGDAGDPRDDEYGNRSLHVDPPVREVARIRSKGIPARTATSRTSAAGPSNWQRTTSSSRMSIEPR